MEHLDLLSQKELLAEVATYQDEILNAHRINNSELASCWQRTEQAARSMIHANSFLGKLQDLEEIPLPSSWTESAEGTRSATKYMLQAFHALQQKNIPLVQQYTSLSESIKKAITLYQYWTTRSYKEMLARYSFCDREAKDMARQYRAQEAAALQINHPFLAQQWAEAACLAQEAFSKARKTKMIFARMSTSPLTHYWTIASYWTYQASLFRAHAAQAIAQKNQEESAYWNTVALFAEQASSSRSKAAKALQAGDQLLMRYWTQAGYWLGNACRYRQQEGPFWKAFSDQAEQVAQTYARAAQSKLSFYQPSFLRRYWSNLALQREQLIQTALVQYSDSLEGADTACNLTLF